MTEDPKLENMGSDRKTGSNFEAGELEERGGQKISVSDHVNGIQQSSTISDSFVVDMETSSQYFIEKLDINANSRITLQRNLSRKGSAGGVEKKINPTLANQNKASMLATSPIATSHGGSTPEKPLLAAFGATDHSFIPHVHHQITIKNGSVGSTASKNKRGFKIFSFRQSPRSLSIDPRRILLFFATLSSVGTILLIYFTLSMGKINGDDNGLN